MGSRLTGMNDERRIALEQALASACAHAEDSRPLVHARARRIDADTWRISVYQGGEQRHWLDIEAMEDGAFKFASGHHRLIADGWEPAGFAICDRTRSHGWREHPDGSYTTPLLFD